MIQNSSFGSDNKMAAVLCQGIIIVHIT